MSFEILIDFIFRFYFIKSLKKPALHLGKPEYILTMSTPLKGSPILRMWTLRLSEV